MSAALQICYSGFDRRFFNFPPKVQSRMGAKIDEMRLRLKTLAHHRLKGHDRYRLRVGDYRIIYHFDAERNIIHLLGVGHRKEIYRVPWSLGVKACVLVRPVRLARAASSSVSLAVAAE
jgi:mRNA interferase RelE/StbE